jgi:hypothetical protein
MAKETESIAATASAPGSKTEKGPAVRLVPTGATDLPILANFARVNLSPSGVLVDLGFLDPAALIALERTARAGGKMPEVVSGRLAGRFALTPDSLVALHQQVGRAIASLRSGRNPTSSTKSN